MSVIDRENAIAKIKDIPYVQEHPNIGLLFEEWLNLMPDAEPTVFDGFFLCDKKPGACPSWTIYGWEKCMNPHCERTSRLDHALKLPDDGWIPCSDCKRRCEKWENLKTLQE